MSHSKQDQHWILQRISAVMLMPLGLWFIYFILVNLGVPGEEIAESFTSSWIAAPMIGLIVFWFYHARLGIEEIIEDYVHQSPLKLFLSMGTKLVLLLMGILSILAVIVMA